MPVAPAGMPRIAQASSDSSAPTRFRMSDAASFWLSAAVIAHTIWTSAAPAMTYPLYAREWHLSPAVTTGIFAVYPVVVVAALILFGDLSDHVGRRLTMLFGLCASLTGVILFAVAPDVTWVFVGRAFMGAGVGLSTSPATAAMVEFSTAGRPERASAIAAVAQSVGLALALLVGGSLIQYAPMPTRLDFVVLAVAIAVLIAFTWFLPSHTRGDGHGRWRPRIPSVPTGLRQSFATATAAVTGAYALGTLTLSLGAQIAHDLIGSGNALVTGLVLSSYALACASTALLAKRLPYRMAIVGGGAFAVLSLVVLALSARLHDLPLFLASTAIGGLGYSLLLLGGLTLINTTAPIRHRGGVLSALYLVAYLGQGVVAMVLGEVATIWTLRVAIDLAALSIASFAAVAIALALAMPRRAA